MIRERSLADGGSTPRPAHRSPTPSARQAEHEPRYGRRAHPRERPVSGPVDRVHDRLRSPATGAPSSRLLVVVDDGAAVDARRNGSDAGIVNRVAESSSHPRASSRICVCSHRAERCRVEPSSPSTSGQRDVSARDCTRPAGAPRRNDLHVRLTGEAAHVGSQGRLRRDRRRDSRQPDRRRARGAARHVAASLSWRRSAPRRAHVQRAHPHSSAGCPRSDAELRTMSLLLDAIPHASTASPSSRSTPTT